LYAVSHCIDNITHKLEIAGEYGYETEEYDVDDYLHESTPTASAFASSSEQPVLNIDGLCDWIEARAKVVYVPSGHSRFCYRHVRIDVLAVLIGNVLYAERELNLSCLFFYLSLYSF
jgi:hypothetical protein